MKATKTGSYITVYVHRPGKGCLPPSTNGLPLDSVTQGMDQRIARIPVFFEGGIPVVTDVIKVEDDYYAKVCDNPLRYVLRTLSKGTLVEDVKGPVIKTLANGETIRGENNGAHHTGRNKRRK